jgi:hypothetical protein
MVARCRLSLLNKALIHQGHIAGVLFSEKLGLGKVSHNEGTPNAKNYI